MAARKPSRLDVLSSFVIAFQAPGILSLVQRVVSGKPPGGWGARNRDALRSQAFLSQCEQRNPGHADRGLQFLLQMINA